MKKKIVITAICFLQLFFTQAQTSFISGVDVSKPIGTAPSSADDGQVLTVRNGSVGGENRLLGFGQLNNYPYLRVFNSGGDGTLRILNSGASSAMMILDQSGNTAYPGQGWFTYNSNGSLTSALSLGQMLNTNSANVNILTKDDGGVNNAYWQGNRWGHTLTFQRQSPSGIKEIFKIAGVESGEHFVSVISSDNRLENVRFSADGNSFIQGKLGVGTNNPVNQFQVSTNGNGNPYVAVNQTADNPFVELQRWTGGASDYYGSRIKANGDALTFELSNTKAVGTQTFSEYMRISSNGNVGIGTTNSGIYKLAVEGTIGARKIKITQSSWADYVFEENYKLPSLTEVEKFIKRHKHLPEVPTAEQIKENGVDVAETQVLLLKKIEELTLYMIEMKNENEEIKKENEEMKKQVSEIKQQLKK